MNNYYKKIYNPKTKKLVNISSKCGIKILKKYINQLGGATYGKPKPTMTSTHVEPIVNHLELFFFQAIKNNNIKQIRQSIKGNVNVNAVMSNGLTPLFVASKNGNMSTVKYLLSHGANVNAKMPDGTTSLDISIENGHRDIVGLLAHYITITSKLFDTPIHISISNLHPPIFKASNDGNIDTVIDLLHDEEQLFAELSNGLTPLFMAIQNGHLDIVTELLIAGIPVNTVIKYGDLKGLTPLFLAIVNKHTDIAAELLNHSADFNIKMPDGMTPLYMASKNGNIDVVVKLQELGVDINVEMPDGDTPIFIASKNGHLNVVKYLAENGATIDNYTLDIAIKNGNMDVVRYLSKIIYNPSSIRGWVPGSNAV